MRPLGAFVKERLFPRPSILSKLMLVIVVTVSLTLTFTGIVLSIYEWSLFRRINTQSITTLAEVIGQNSAAALAFDDQQVGAEILNALTSEPEVLLGCLYTKDGGLLATYSRKDNTDACPKTTPPPGHRFEVGRLFLSRPIVHQGDTLGSIFLLSDTQNLRQRLLFFLFVLTVLMGVDGFVALGITLRLHHIVTDPILKLAETARFISEEGQYSLRAKRNTEIEINSLVDAFNRMLDVIQEREESIRKSEEQFRATFEVAAVGNALVSPEGRFLRVNSELCRMTGYSREELLQLNFIDITYPEDAEISRQAFVTMLSGANDPYIFEKRYIKKSGEMLWVLLSSAPIRDPLGKVVAIISVIQNITERKHAEEERNQLLSREREARLEAERSIQVRDDFLSIASHELRTPLTPLKLHIQILKRETKNLDPKKFPRVLVLFQLIEIAERQIDHLEKLIEGLLDVSRMRAGRLQLNRERVDLSSLVGEVVERMKPEFKQAGCDVKFEAQSQILGFWDRLRVEQIVVNLLANAMKYGAQKPVEIKVLAVDEKARLIVRDHGIGISKEDQKKIFGRFERMAPVTNYPGLGLGLYITRELVKAHHGAIAVESELGQGSTFFVEFPLTR